MVVDGELSKISAEPPEGRAEAVETTLQDAHNNRCEGLRVEVVGTCIEDVRAHPLLCLSCRHPTRIAVSLSWGKREQAFHGHGAWAIMDGTGFAQVIPAAMPPPRRGADATTALVPEVGSAYRVRGVLHFFREQVRSTFRCKRQP